MMRSLVTSIVLLLALHFVALGGVVGWLGATDRLSEARIRRVVEMFEPTLDQEQQQRAEQERQAEAEHEKARQAARLEAVAEGPQTLQDHLATEQHADAMAMHRVERFQREAEDLRQQIERAKELISEQQQALQVKREQFEQAVQQHNEQQESEDFQQTVRMYEQLRADQTKRIFKQLMEQGESDLVVEYLAAMQLRKAAKVLEEFETPAEVTQATTLLEGLRRRGVFPLDDQAGERVMDDRQEDDRT